MIGSDPGFDDEVHRRLGRTPEVVESGFLEDLAKLRLAGLGAEGQRPPPATANWACRRTMTPRRTGPPSGSRRCSSGAGRWRTARPARPCRRAGGAPGRAGRRRPGRPCHAGSRRSRSGRTARRSPCAVATWNSARSLTPASRARSRQVSIEGAWKSNPENVEFGYAVAIVTTDAPCPHPTSATRAPALSFASTPSSAGIHEVVR